MAYVTRDDTVALGCDHGGFDLLNTIEANLKTRGYNTRRFGSRTGETVDYPDVALKTCGEVTSGAAKCAILVCGTGIGMSIAANKIKGIRAAVCCDEYSARYTRLHNDANVLCLGGRVTGPGVALELVEIFFATEFEGGRHLRRINAVAAIENGESEKAED